MTIGLLLFIGLCGALAYFYLKEEAKTKRISEALRVSHINGTEQQIKYLCERLETDERIQDGRMGPSRQIQCPEG